MTAYEIFAKARTLTFLPHSRTTVGCDSLWLKKDCESVVNLGYTNRKSLDGGSVPLPPHLAPQSPLKDAAGLLRTPQQPSWVALLNQPIRALQPSPTRSFFGPLYTHLPPHFLDILQNRSCSNQGRPSEAPAWSQVCAPPGDEALCCRTQAMTDNALWETLELLSKKQKSENPEYEEIFPNNITKR